MNLKFKSKENLSKCILESEKLKKEVKLIFGDIKKAFDIYNYLEILNRIIKNNPENSKILLKCSNQVIEEGKDNDILLQKGGGSSGGHGGHGGHGGSSGGHGGHGGHGGQGSGHGGPGTGHGGPGGGFSAGGSFGVSVGRDGFSMGGGFHVGVGKTNGGFKGRK